MRGVGTNPVENTLDVIDVLVDVKARALALKNILLALECLGAENNTLGMLSFDLGDIAEDVAKVIAFLEADNH